ncbi:hypothetical protein ACIA49_21820 [Kribbella sp. NPDC051587]|uniref:hypothetical protein n=1 Tax=Kribbella sp. NPDC051587 TaxID=3364119 RepID=UPI0037AABA75
MSYAFKGGQHAHHLASYKSNPGSAAAQVALHYLGSLFLRDHLPCLRSAAGIGYGLSHLVMIPSTKGRPGPHPLDSMLGPIMNQFPRIQVGVNVPYSDREFHADWFVTESCQNADVLILDDTWTTGARIQSMSHALKSAGARSVVAVVLGRHVDPGWAGSKPLVDWAKSSQYDPTRCAVDG